GVSLAAGVLTVPAGVTAFTISYPTTSDSVFEGDETVNVSVGSLSAVGTIVEDDSVPAIASITSDQVTEGQTLVHTVTLTNASATSGTFAFALAGNTAEANDFGAPTFSNGVSLAAGVLTVPAGVTSFTISYPTTHDTVFEGNETVNVSVGGLTGVGTIIENDAPPTLTITDDTQQEGNSLIHVVRLSNATEQPTVYSFGLAGTTASATDFGAPVFSNGVTLLAGQITVPAGVTRFTVTVPTIEDAIDENTERLNVFVGGVTAIGTIIDDDDPLPPAAPVNTVPGTQNGVEDTAVTFSGMRRIMVADADGGPLTAVLNVTNGTLTVVAAQGAVVTNNGTGTITIVGGANAINNTLSGMVFNPTPDYNGSATLTVQTSDGLQTDTDTVSITVAAVVDIAPNSATTEAGVPVTIDVLGNDTFENTGHVISAINGNAITDGGASVAVANGSVALVGGQLVFTPQSGFVGPVPTFNYTVSSGGVTETSTVDVEVESSASIASVTDASITEGGDLIHTVTLSQAALIPLSFAFGIADDTTSAADYGVATFSDGVTFADGAVTVPAGVTSFTVTVPTTSDAIDESDESYTLSVGGIDATGTITDDDTAEISINDVTVGEADGFATFTVSLSTPSAVPVTVVYGTGDGTAVSGSDFTTAGGTVTFAVGETAQSIVVPITSDLVDESDETFSVSLSGAVGAGIADGVGIGTITDDDSATVSINDVTVGEADGFATFTVTLSTPSSSEVTVAYGSADGTALDGFDYSAVGGTLTFAAGVTTQTIVVPVAGDVIVEQGETFTIGLSGAVGATIADGVGIGTITDDDSATVSINDVTVGEADGFATFTVTLSTPSSDPVTVAYGSADGTAIDGADYTGVSGTVTFAAGQTTQTIVVAITSDVTDENSETFSVSLSGAVGAGIGDGVGIATITDDDTAVLSVDDVAVGEADGFATFTVSLSTPSAVAVTVAYGTTDGTAGGADYEGTSGTLTFAPGETIQTVVVAITSDTTDEPDETFTLNLSSAVNATIADGQGVGTITDDEGVPTISSITAETQDEGTDL
ncbi:Calx-beta domain-containing protein, partial [Caenimonas sp. SL110]|uniref:beta strand repeat-containing protein n=1 Tax=Caenimonas sp. SL110 TaxID=1450524 RepID=UPI00065372F1